MVFYRRNITVRSREIKMYRIFVLLLLLGMDDLKLKILESYVRSSDNCLIDNLILIDRLKIGEKDK